MLLMEDEKNEREKRAGGVETCKARTCREQLEWDSEREERMGRKGREKGESLSHGKLLSLLRGVDAWFSFSDSLGRYFLIKAAMTGRKYLPCC
jgi:hypothetical protein